MSMRCFVGIDTSNYTTSAAICSEAGEILANIKAPLPVRGGECGLRQSDAVFAHVKNLPTVTAQLREVLERYEVMAVGCSARPRNAEGSYMPCFLAGISAANAMASVLNVPLLEFSHQDGHIMAAAYSSGRAESLMKAPFGAFHVSGGTTEVLYVSPTARGFDVRLLGETLDINAGQAIDRVGVMMGLQFPCGKEMERLSAGFTGMFPKLRISVKDGNCNLSGLQNLAEKQWRETADPSAVSAYVFYFVGKTLQAMTAAFDARFSGLPILYAGGVMSNLTLQKMLGARPNTYFAEPAFSADNAAGIALLCRKRFFDL